MKVKCVLCETIDNLDDELPLAKKLRNRLIHTYMCDECYERIEVRTKERLSTGNFKLFRTDKKEDEW